MPACPPVMLHISGTIHHMRLSLVIHKWKIMILYPGDFFLHFLKILIFQNINVIKGPKIAQNDKIFRLLLLISQKQYITWSWWGYISVKEHKIPQKDKKVCLSHSISKEPKILIFIFGTLLQKDHMSFFISSKFSFSGMLEGKRARSCPKWQKILSVELHISGTNMIWLSFVIHKCKMIIFPGALYIFSKF